MTYPPTWQARENKWRSIRYGLEAELVMNTSGKTKLLLEDLDDWLNKLQPYIENLGYQGYINNLRQIMKYGTSTDRQKKVFQKTNSLEKVVAHNMAEFIKQEPLW